MSAHHGVPGGSRIIQAATGPPSSHQVPVRTIPEWQELARRRLALCLVALLAVEILGFMGGVLVPPIFGVPAPIESLKEMMVIIFGPTVALVGSATGFYFASNLQSGIGAVVSPTPVVTPPTPRGQRSPAPTTTPPSVSGSGAPT